MKKLKGLLIYFLSRIPREPGRTELVKLVYLFEHYHTLAYGQQYSNTCFIRYHNGPYSEAILDAIKETPEIKENQYSGNKGIGYSYSLLGTLMPEQYNLPPEQKSLADFVIKVTRHKRLDDLLELVYNTPPMVKVIVAEERAKCYFYGEVLDMNTRKTIPKFSKQELQEARERNAQRKRRGTDEEYYANLITDFQALSLLRRRANECQMPPK